MKQENVECLVMTITVVLLVITIILEIKFL
jgi:hypothetical protein